jgi:hypothetical protein
MHKSNLIRGMLGFKNGTPVDKKWEDGLIDNAMQSGQRRIKMCWPTLQGRRLMLWRILSTRLSTLPGTKVKRNT